ncbi:MAG: tetratricopeptide repeat protein [Gammaproteobacteria bacterium]|nr:tetratricopeptide repeat protein [Gammaproteobacteria bacterium]
MESAREVPLFSQLSTVSIKNYNDKIVVNLLPTLEQVLETASAYVSPNTIIDSAVGVASGINELSSAVHLSYSNAQTQNAGRTLTIKEPPLEIIIEQPLDESSLVNLSRLLGEHTPASMSQEETASLIALLEKNQVDHLKIKSTGVRFVFRILEQTFRPLYRLPPQFEHFTGRQEELTMLREGRDSVKVIAPRENLPPEEKHDKRFSQIAGTGGIGKSQLANYYARLQFREKNYDWIIWMVGGEDDQRAHNNLSSQFADLGLALGLDVKQLKDEVLHKLIYQRLAAKGRGLVVIDDAPNYNVVKSFLPERFDHREIDVLITTRNSHTFDSVLTKILLDVFTLGDAKQYIHRLLKETVTEADAEVLAITLDRYPLALTQALAYILNNHCTIAEYCQRYTTLRVAQKKYLETPVYEDDPYQLEHQKRQRKFEATMKAVVELSMEQVRTICQTEEAFGRAKTVLLAATYLAPEAAIPKGLLGAWIPKYEGEIEINDALNVLRALSLLEEDSQLAAYRMHQVVQDTLKLEETPTATQMKLLQWVKNFERHLESSGTYFRTLDEQKYKLLEAHMIVLAQHLSRQPREDEFLEGEVFMLMAAGNAFGLQGKGETAKYYFETALKCHCQISTRSTKKQNEGFCLMSLGAATLTCGDPKGAKKHIEEALSILHLTLREEEHGVFAQGLMNLGLATLSCGDPRGAKRLLEEALPILRAALGETHADVGLCQMNLGSATLSCGDPRGAKGLLEAALPILQAASGKDHANVGRCQINLGSATLSCGDPRGAKAHLEAALPILRAALGEAHADLGGCQANLGLATLSCGDPQAAKGDLEAALPILRAALGEAHADVGLCQMNLGFATLSCGDPRDAKTHLEAALPILRAALGEAHADLGRCQANLGSATLSCGDPRGAKAHLQAALPILRAALGEAHADAGRCQMNLGWATQSCGDPQAAKAHLQAALPILRAALGEAHADVGLCQVNLGSATLSCGDPRGAKAHLEAALPILRAALGEPHADVGLCQMNLGSATLSCGDPRGAKAHLEAALPILRAALGEGHANVGLCQMSLGMAILLCDDPKGTGHLETALPILRATLGEGHANVGLCQMNLGMAILSSGDSDNAKTYLEKALQIFRDFFGDDHEYVKKCQSLLAEAYQDSRKHIQPVANKDQGRLLLNNWNTEDPPQAIRRAATHGTSHELSSLLQQFPAYINGRDSNPQKGYTALHWAVLKRRADNIAVLLELGARVDIQDNQGRTIIDCALEDHHPPIIDLFKRALLRRYKDNYMGESQLDIIVRLCAQNNDTEGLKLLIHLKVPLDHADTNTGQTALHLAVINGDENFIRLLLEAGADRSLEDFMGNTALSLAEEKNELLMDKIADDVLAALSDDGLEDTSACSL